MVIIFIIPLQYGDYLSDCRLPTPPITVCAESGWLCLCADPGAGGNCSCTKVPGQAPDCRGKKSPGCSAPGVADFKKKGLFIGYRGYEKQKITPAFCFGHGLSYSEFSYSNLQARACQSTSRTQANSLAQTPRSCISASRLALGSLRNSSKASTRPPCWPLVIRRP